MVITQARQSHDEYKYVATGDVTVLCASRIYFVNYRAIVERNYAF